MNDKPDEPTERASCPDEQTLAEFVAGTMDAASRAAVETHLSRCALCRYEMARLDEDRPASLWGAPAGWRLILRAAVAAGALAAVAGIGIWISRPIRQPPIVSPLPAGEPVIGTDGTFAAERDRSRILELPDRTRLRLLPGSEIRFLPPVGGERCHLSLDRGELEADVNKSPGRFRVVHAAGEIEVLGTRLQARDVPLSLEAALAPAPPEMASASAERCLCVEVLDGKAALSTTKGRVTLTPATRGIALPGEPPFQQERSTGWESALASFSRSLEPAEKTWTIRPGKGTDARLMAATLWGFAWRSEAEWRAWEQNETDERLKAAGRVLLSARFPKSTAKR